MNDNVEQQVETLLNEMAYAPPEQLNYYAIYCPEGGSPTWVTAKNPDEAMRRYHGDIAVVVSSLVWRHTAEPVNQQELQANGFKLSPTLKCPHTEDTSWKDWNLTV